MNSDMVKPMPASAPGNVAAAQRTVAEHVAQWPLDLVAHLGNTLVGGAAGRAGVAAIFDECDGGIGRAENMVVGPDAPIQAVSLRRLGHAFSIASHLSAAQRKYSSPEMASSPAVRGQSIIGTLIRSH